MSESRLADDPVKATPSTVCQSCDIWQASDTEELRDGDLQASLCFRAPGSAESWYIDALPKPRQTISFPSNASELASVVLGFLEVASGEISSRCILIVNDLGAERLSTPICLTAA